MRQDALAGRMASVMMGVLVASLDSRPYHIF